MDTIRYMRRANLGNYSHEELDITTVVEEGQDRASAFKELKDFVLEALNLAPEKVEAPKNKIEVKEEVKVLKEKPLPAKEVKKEEVVVKEEVDTTPAPSHAELKKAVEADKAEKKTPAKKEAIIKVKPTKATAYDRTHDPHKALLGKFLDEDYRGWRGKESLPKAIEASKQLNGSEFQDGEGNILETFKTEFRKLMA